MAGINVARPQGRVPRSNPVARPPGSAEVALDIDLDNGTWRPWRTPLEVFDTATGGGGGGGGGSGPPPLVVSFALADCCWVSFDGCVDIVTPFTPACPYVIITGRTMFPEIATPQDACIGNWCRLGVPCPPTALTYACEMDEGGTVPVPIAVPGETMSLRAYRYTYVNRLGQEGPGSPPSQMIRANDGARITVCGFVKPESEWCVDRVRLYRLATPYETGLEQSNPANTEWFLVEEIRIGSLFTYVDTKTDLELGNGAQGVFVTDEYLPPPSDLTGIVSCENGIIAGISPSTKTVWMCEPHAPHSWPLRYMKKFYGTPVALAAAGAALYVGTTERPYVINLSDPGNANGAVPVLGTRVPLPCVSKRSMVADTNSAYYASTDGLVALAGGEAKIISQSRLSERDWQELRPNRMIGHVRKGYYHGYTDVAGIRFRTIDQEHATINEIGYTNLSERPFGLWRHPDGELYYSEGTKIFKWNAGDRLREYTWQASLTKFQRRTALTAAQLDRAKGGRAQFTLITDYGRIFTRQVDHSSYFRIKGKQNAAFASVEIKGTAEVFEYSLATSILDVARAQASNAT